MPIILNDKDQKNKQVKLFEPKYFNSTLSGSGKKAGVLNNAINPCNANNNLTQNLYPTTTYPKKETIKNGNLTVKQTPIYIFPMDMVYIGSEKLDPNAVLIFNHNNIKIHLSMNVNAVEQQEKINSYDKGNTTDKKTYIMYSVRLWYQYQNDDKFRIAKYHNLASTMKNTFIEAITFNPIIAIEQLIKNTGIEKIGIDTVKIEKLINDFDVYSNICQSSENWQTNIDKIIEEKLQTIPKDILNNQSTIIALQNFIKYIETYEIPLQLYENILNVIQKYIPSNISNLLCKKNLNLLLMDTLNNVKQKKIPNVKIDPMKRTLDPKFSKQQIEIINTTEPLVLVQSGAGSGKSTVILERIKTMIANGIKPQDILVLSFTNAAADNIKEKTTDDVKSLTIANMIHQIYSNNYPNHQLSSIDTIINSLGIYYPNNDIALEFRQHLFEVKGNRKGSFTSINNFISENFDKVVDILNTIQQTALEIEIIVCNLKIGKFVEPKTIRNKYLIVDEVQDNSIFEFIYLIKYIEKHAEPIMLIGDGAQTLFEFRASNPRALNTLEMTKVFKTYTLSTNYRSNQEILDFANILLDTIEANQYAKIQLKANSLIKVTKKSFQKAVTVDYQELNKIKDFKDRLYISMNNDIKKYIDDKLIKGEKVAFLAYTRKHIGWVEQKLKELYPKEKINNLVPEKMLNSTIFSLFIRKYWDEIKFVPTKNIYSTICQNILNRLEHLVYDQTTSEPHIRRILKMWVEQNKDTIITWQSQYTKNQISKDEFFDLVKENLLDFEIKNNAIRQALLSNRNKENKLNETIDGNLILSTIHSAKGLEFDNVVLIFQNKNIMSEENKRMYYVALTRAIKSEYIYAYDTVKSPKIVADYNTILGQLK